jgi:molybdopterin converting factor subunit 1
MKVTVKYFGAIAEQTGRNEEMLDLGVIGSQVQDVKSFCLKKYSLADEESLQLAVNQELNKEGELSDGDEVAFLPPFAGG